MRAVSTTIAATGSARRWFRAFRRTRPFWGGLWCALGGVWIMRMMSFPILLAARGGFDYSAGYILGGGLLLFGLVAWFSPHYAQLVGLLAVIVSLAAFVAANLGGLVIGTVLGIVGGAMVWGWGEKVPRRPRRRRPRVGADATT